jgi:hypothetical protein
LLLLVLVVVVVVVVLLFDLGAGKNAREFMCNAPIAHLVPR